MLLRRVKKLKLSINFDSLAVTKSFFQCFVAFAYTKSADPNGQLKKQDKWNCNKYLGYGIGRCEKS